MSEQQVLTRKYYVVYYDGSRLRTLDPTEANNVIINEERGIWIVDHGNGRQETFNIGSGERVPEGGILWGPAFVGEEQNLLHDANLKRFEKNFSKGTLTR